VEALFDLPPGQAQSVIDANREDMRPGCAPVHSIAPAAERVTSFDGQAVLYDTRGDDRVAFTSTVTDAEGMTWYTVTSLVRVADVLLFLKAMSTEPILESMMRELTLRAAEKVEAIR
jgi:hypothetical protein